MAYEGYNDLRSYDTGARGGSDGRGGGGFNGTGYNNYSTPASSNSGGSGYGAIAGAMFDIAGGLMAAFEQKRQIQAEKELINASSQLIRGRLIQQKYDLDRRSRILGGRIYASAGGGGVTTEGSVTNAAADVYAQTAVDKLRVEVNAQNEISLNNFRVAELTRQSKVAMKTAYYNSVAKAGTAAVGMM